MKAFFSRPQAQVNALFLILAIAFWSRVLFTGQVLLPGAMLGGFLPFGNDSKAPWTILQWDALAQYFPWRHFAAQNLQNGQIPLWNPYEFAGTPFLANGQSALFYPLNLPFWIFDTDYAFGVVALLHTLLALFGTYFLARRWNQSRAGAVVAATIYAFSGYLMSWALLPTLFATACWLPLCLYFYELAVDGTQIGASRAGSNSGENDSSLRKNACAPILNDSDAGKNDSNRGKNDFSLGLNDSSSRENGSRPIFNGLATVGLILSLACALLAGHAQIFFYVLLALALRQPFLKRKWRGLAIGIGAPIWALVLGALQLLPTLELARIGHRAGGVATLEGWEGVRVRALQMADLPSLAVPAFPLGWGTLNENFAYVGIGALILALAGIFAKKAHPARWFALFLALFGLFYALGTPLSQGFFFGVPGLSQMGGVGRALLLWSLGVAILAGFGLDFLRAKLQKSGIALLALGLVALELFANGFLVQPTAPRAQIYPKTALTDFLKTQTDERNRVLFWTDKRQWLPSEAFSGAERAHPSGILPPNGATFYGIYEVNGYDSLSLRQYRAWIGGEEANGPSPALNGNMVMLNNVNSPILDSLDVRFLVVPSGFSPIPVGKLVFEGDGCQVFRREIALSGPKASGKSFAPGFRDGKYAPETFRLGTFLSLCALGFLTAMAVQTNSNRASSRVES